MRRGDTSPEERDAGAEDEARITGGSGRTFCLERIRMLAVRLEVESEACSQMLHDNPDPSASSALKCGWKLRFL